MQKMWQKEVNRPESTFIRLEFIVPTFVTNVTEYLCTGWVFFSDKFRLF